MFVLGHFVFQFRCKVVRDWDYPPGFPDKGYPASSRSLDSLIENRKLSAGRESPAECWNAWVLMHCCWIAVH